MGDFLKPRGSRVIIVSTCTARAEAICMASSKSSSLCCKAMARSLCSTGATVQTLVISWIKVRASLCVSNFPRM